MLLINKPPSHNKVIISHPSQIILGAIFISTRSDLGIVFWAGEWRAHQSNKNPKKNQTFLWELKTQGQLLGINVFWWKSHGHRVGFFRWGGVTYQDYTSFSFWKDRLLPGCWFQSIWKICSSNWIISPRFGDYTTQLYRGCLSRIPINQSV